MDNNNDKKNPVPQIKSENPDSKDALPKTFEHLHERPVLRRDFLASGLIPFSASLVMPSWLNIFANAGVAEAEELICKSAGGSSMCAYIGLKLSGGAGLAMNYVPTLDEQGTLMLDSYSKMGLGKQGRFSTVPLFANNVPFWTTGNVNSGIYNGIIQGAQGAQAKAVFFGIPVRSGDDSSTNKLDPSGMIGKAGLVGSLLPAMGRANTDTGMNALPAIVKPDSPLIVSRYEDVLGSLSVTGTLARLEKPQREKLFGLVKRMTASQAKDIAKLSGGKTLSKLAQCASIGNEELIKNAASLDISPLTNTAFAQAWGITAQTSTSSQDYVFATMAYNAITGKCGTVNLDMGGYDYHDGTRTSGDARDTAAGVVIGKILRSFEILGKRGVIFVCSDGAVSSSDSLDPNSPWMSDRGTAGCMYFIAYDPAVAPTALGTQIGRFTQDQVADDTTLSGSTTETAAATVAANYLAFNKKISLFESVAPRIFSTEDLDKILKIKTS